MAPTERSLTEHERKRLAEMSQSVQKASKAMREFCTPSRDFARRYTVTGDEPSDVGRDFMRFRDGDASEDDVAGDADVYRTRDVLLVCITVIAAAIGFGLAIWGILV